jgi:tRNA threonylcarbamoyladenosine biosynthesis protein TsaE
VNAEWSLRVHTDDPEGTRRLGAALAARSLPGDVVLLVGGLGAGKTVLAQGFAAALGVEGPVTSPTFTLLRQYECGDGGPVRRLLHADLYRLDHLTEVVDLALPELLEEDAVALVEWGDAGAPVLGDSALEVTLTVGAAEDVAGPEGRTISLRARGAGWHGRRASVVAAIEERALTPIEAAR